ncbi:hypothetical protein [Streptomyces sp. NPDC002540]
MRGAVTLALDSRTRWPAEVTYEKRRRVERRSLPQPAHHADEPLNEHGTGPLGVDGVGTGLYTSGQAAVVATALVSQIHAAAAELAGLAEHLLVLKKHGYAQRHWAIDGGPGT